MGKQNPIVPAKCQTLQNGNLCAYRDGFCECKRELFAKIGERASKFNRKHPLCHMQAVLEW